ncbi:MAG: serine O-acetyltransferase, partial [Thermoanaerobaculia bacterium]
VGLVVGGQTVIGEDCTLLHGVTLGEARFDELDCPRIGDRVTIGAGAKVLGGISVGDDAMIGANTVVLRDVPAGAVVAGIPARVVGSRRTLTVAALLLAAALPLAPLAAAPVKVCDDATSITPVGVDTKAGLTLLALPGRDGGRGWLLELPADGRAARLHQDTTKGRSGGSVGPGPVLATLPCGPSCIQPVRWQEGAWEKLGEPFAAPSVATVATTWDDTGHPWVVLHGQRQAGGRMTAWAFRLETGAREWKAKGSLVVAAVGPPEAIPAPQRKDGILSGSGLFAASGRPTQWLSGLPVLPEGKRGQVVPLAGNAAAYLAAGGAVYVSRDGGKKWARSPWTPWGAARITETWRQGSDFWVDLPVGVQRGPLQLAWFDRRVPKDARLYLTELDAKTQWRVVAQGAPEVKTKGDTPLAVSHLLAPREGDWLVLHGCVATPEGSGLVVRTAGPDGLSAPKLVPLRR